MVQTSSIEISRQSYWGAEKLLFFDVVALRIPAIYGAKTNKNQTPLVCFAWLFYNQTVFQIFEHSFFDQVVIDAKNV